MNEDGYPELLDEEEASREATDTYILRRVYYKNKAAPDLKKYMISLKGNVTRAVLPIKTRVLLSRNYRPIVAPRKFDVRKSNT